MSRICGARRCPFRRRARREIHLPAPARLLSLFQIASPIVRLFKDAQRDPAGQAAGIVHHVAAVTGVEAEPSSFIIPLMTVTLGMDDMVATFGGVVAGNAGKTYAAADLTPARALQLNRGVQRIAADTKAVAYADRWHRTSGRFEIPLVAIHNAVDPLVPHAQLAGLERAARAAGTSGRLMALTVPTMTTPLPGTGLSGFTHCGFTPAQTAAAWTALTTWTRTGKRPPTPELEKPAA